MGKPSANPPDAKEREFWIAVRQAFLMLVDAIERHKLETNPTTAELRKERAKRI